MVALCEILQPETACPCSSCQKSAAGYGDVSPNNCWLANTVITIQSVYALLLNAVVLGIVFARVSRPGQRVGACLCTGRKPI
jgi:Inward rectifier potassium channel transmembrane domain